MNGRTSSVWHEAATSAEVIAQAAGEHDALTRQASAQADREGPRDLLLRVTDAGRQLAKCLDELAEQYRAPGAVEPSPVYIALDQAAAAAEDMGTCAKVAAQAIEKQR